MPQTALHNPLVLAILGLLAERDRHQYALLSDLRARYPFLRAKTSSVYTLVTTLTRSGLVTLQRPTDGSDRQQAALTPAGVTELKVQVEQHLLRSDPAIDPRFLIALAYLAILGPTRAVEVLSTRAMQMQDQHRQLTSTLTELAVADLHMIEAHFLASRLEHDASWFDHLAEQLRTGHLKWPT